MFNIMEKGQKQILIRSLPVYLLCAGLIFVLFMVFRKHPPRNPNTPLGKSIAKYLQGDEAELHTMQEIIDNRSLWDPVLMDWYGRGAEDFSFRDIYGNEHSLSDYAGRNVIVVLWASWCPPCVMEAPHLMELRKSFAIDELVIIAISNESPKAVEEFALENGLNYTVASSSEPLPEPFRLARGIPASFYIDRQGKIMLAAEGLVPFGQARAILKVMDSPTE
jgi:peroxiredoxin